MKLWSPSEEQITSSNIARLEALLAERHQTSFADFHDLYDWSVENENEFWEACWDLFEIKASTRFEQVVEGFDKMPGAKWFPGSRLNFAENLLRRSDDQPAIVFWGEEKVRRELSFSELREAAVALATQFKKDGIKPGDRIAGFVPNMPEAIIAMIATTAVGAIWCSASPDFGVEGLVDRFSQVEPRILVTADGYWYKGKTQNSLAKVNEVLPRLTSVERVLVIPYLEESPDITTVQNSEHFYEYADQSSVDNFQFEQLPPDHPVYIMFSSGTTGRPKCIAHGAAGTLIEHFKELALHTDLKKDERIFYATTCGWMMWNWLVSSLGLGSTVVLYDGFPLASGGRILMDLAEKEQVNVFGTSAGYISALRQEGLTPKDSHDLSSLRAILSTGSPLAPESFDYVYREIKEDLQLSSISGGTDIVGCFALGSPTLPVHRGELQTRSLGYAVDIFDEDGNSVIDKKGDLVCTKPFPSMPVSFWNDPDGSKYHDAYFDHFDGVWRHGDYAKLTPNNGVIIYGRSDTTLNPGGVRIGTAEIYRQLSEFPEIAGSIVVGQRWKNDQRIILFLKLAKNTTLTEDLTTKIKQTIRENASPRHVPSKIIAVSDIPVTRSGKRSEAAVRLVIHGEEPNNVQALANPECLNDFKDCPELAED